MSDENNDSNDSESRETTNSIPSPVPSSRDGANIPTSPHVPTSFHDGKVEADENDDLNEEDEFEAVEEDHRVDGLAASENEASNDVADHQLLGDDSDDAALDGIDIAPPLLPDPAPNLDRLDGGGINERLRPPLPPRNATPQKSPLVPPFLIYVTISTTLPILLLLGTLKANDFTFYPTMVALGASKLTALLVGNASVSICMLFYRLICSVFLSRPLTSTERSELSSKIKYTLTETCLALNIFRDEIDVWLFSRFVVLVTGKGIVGMIGGRVRMLQG